MTKIEFCKPELEIALATLESAYEQLDTPENWREQAKTMEWLDQTVTKFREAYFNVQPVV